jgi:hypothetical protein
VPNAFGAGVLTDFGVRQLLEPVSMALIEIAARLSSDGDACLRPSWT